MSRLIFVPQFPSQMRYQEWWYSEFPKEFEKYYDDVHVLGQGYPSLVGSMKARSESYMFSPIREAFTIESNQIHEFYDMKLYDDDTLFLSDLSFPGFFSNVLHHKRTKKMFAFCHATSLNNYDYFQPVRDSKWLVESGHAKLFDAIFVGSEYHKKKLGWSNVIVTGVPKPPFDTFKDKKTIDILSISRPNIQKVNKKLEKIVEKNFGKIYRSETFTWASYYHLISNSKVVLFSGKEDTFGYGVLEAVMNNSVPVGPDKFSYPELLDKEYLYSDEVDAQFVIWHFLKHPEEVPKIKCMNLVNNFYENVVKTMKGE